MTIIDEKKERKKMLLKIIVLFIVLIIFNVAYFAMVINNPDLYLNERKKLLSHDCIRDFSISNNNEMIAYFIQFGEHPNYKYEIRIFNIKTEEDKKVITCDDWVGKPIFNKDDTKIYFNGYNNKNGNISVIDIDGSNKRQITTNGGLNPVFNNDHSKIIFEKEGKEETIEMWGRVFTGSVSNIWIMDINGSNQKQLTNFCYPFDPYVKDISPDNSKILFSIRQHEHAIERRRGSFEEMEDMHGIWEVNMDGTNLHRIVDGEKSAIEYSPDGKKILFYTSIYYHHTYFWIVNTDGSNVKELSPIKEFDYYYRRVRFHPNGKDILYTVHIASSSHSEEIWLMDYNGGNRRMIHKIYDQDIYGVAFVDNGNKLIYRVFDQNKDQDIMYMMEINIETINILNIIIWIILFAINIIIVILIGYCIYKIKKQTKKKDEINVQNR